MPTALQTPIRREDEAQQVGPKRYRKQILPVGKVPYEGKELDFSREYLAKVQKAFNAGAYDQVAFQLASDQNEHNLDPEKTRGEITATELADDGLYGIFDLSEEGAKLVGDNPKLGVSCRIVQDHPKGPAIQHVLATLDPRATGMKPWEALDLAKAEKGTTLIDLSGGEYTTDTVSKDAQLSADEAAALRKLLAKDGKEEGENSDLSDEERAELDAVVERILGEETEDKTPTPALSKEQTDAIELAKSTATKANERADSLEQRLAESDWKQRRDRFVRKGVPPALLDLAEPHLSKASTVIDLSRSDSTASAMLKMLEEAEGTIDLSERGGADAEDRDETEALLKKWDERDGKRTETAAD